MLTDLGMAAAAVLAAVFAWAGAAKLTQPISTADGFAGLGLPRPGVLARAVPLVELGLAVALLAAPTPGAAAAVVLLVGFSVVIARALRRGVEVRCACFGQAGGPPLSWIDLVRNGLLVLLATFAAAAGLQPHVPAPAALAVTAAATLMGRGFLQVLRRSRFDVPDGGPRPPGGG